METSQIPTKKVKFDDRINRAIDGFFETNEYPHQNWLAKSGSLPQVQDLTAETFTGKIDKWQDVLKQAILYLPGTLVLYLASMTTVFFYEDVSLNFWTFFWFASGSFLVWAGIGDLKRKEHLLLPVSIIVPSLILAGLLKLLPEFLWSKAFFQDSIYLVPVLLILPFLVKGILGQKSPSE